MLDELKIKNEPRKKRSGSVTKTRQTKALFFRVQQRAGFSNPKRIILFEPLGGGKVAAAEALPSLLPRHAVGTTWRWCVRHA
jgi:hypothetical protein